MLVCVGLQHVVSPQACTQWLLCRLNFRPEQKLALAGTIQFAASLQTVREQLGPVFPSLAVPQSRPLSPGAFNFAMVLSGMV